MGVRFLGAPALPGLSTTRIVVRFPPLVGAMEMAAMKHDARVVANSLIEKGGEAGFGLTPLEIIKLVYFCHGWMLGLYRRPLIEQHVQAWRYGPVVADVYHSLKQHGGDPVTEPIRFETAVPKADFDELESDLVRQVYDVYGQLGGITLSRLTHAPGTPWHTVWNKEGRNATIPNALIQEHYAAKAKDS